MRRTKRTSPRLESLEDKALLSTVSALEVPRVAVAAQTATPQEVLSAMPSVAEINAFQTDGQLGTAELVDSRLAQLFATRADVQQYANTVVQQHATDDVVHEALASDRNVVLNPVPGSDVQPMIRSVVAAIGSQNFDQAYLQAMQQINAQHIQAHQALASASPEAGVQQYANMGAATDANHLQGATNLLNGQAANLNAPPTIGPSNGTLTGNDVMLLTQHNSLGQADWLLSNVAALTASRPEVQQYAMKLVADHTHDAIWTNRVALASGVSLPATLQPAQQQLAQQVLATANSGNFENAYLAAMTQTHPQLANINQQIVNTTQNPNLRALGMMSIPTDVVHQIGAVSLFNSGQRRSSAAGRSTSSSSTTRVTASTSPSEPREAARPTSADIALNVMGRDPNGQRLSDGQAAVLFTNALFTQLPSPARTRPTSPACPTGRPSSATGSATPATASPTTSPTATTASSTTTSSPSTPPAGRTTPASASPGRTPWSCSSNPCWPRSRPRPLLSECPSSSHATGGILPARRITRSDHQSNRPILTESGGSGRSPRSSPPAPAGRPSPRRARAAGSARAGRAAGDRPTPRTGAGSPSVATGKTPSRAAAASSPVIAGSTTPRKSSSSAYRFADRLVTTSTIATQTPSLSRAAHFETKRRRFSGRSLFEGLTISTAATRRRRRLVS